MIPIFSTIVISMALISCKEQPVIFDFVFLFFLSAIISFFNWKKVLKQFNHGYQWNLIEENFYPTDQGGDHGQSKLASIQRQKALILKLGSENTGLNSTFKALFIGAIFAFYLLKYSSPTSIFASSLSLLFLGFYLRSNFWGTYKLSVGFSIVLFALFLDTTNIFKLSLIIAYLPIYFFTMKLLNAFFYQKLNEQFQEESITMNIPYKAISIALISFILLNLALPQKRSLFDLKSHQLTKTALEKNAELKKVVPDYFKKNKLPLDQLKDLSIDPNLLDQLTKLQNSIELNQDQLASSFEDFASFNQQLDQWKEVNDKVFNELVRKDTDLNLKIKNMPAYTNALNAFANQDLSQEGMNQLSQELFGKEGNAKQVKKIEEFINRMKSGKELEIKDQLELEKVLTGLSQDKNLSHKSKETLHHLKQKLNAQQLSAVAQKKSNDSMDDYHAFRNELKTITQAQEAKLLQKSEQSKKKDWLKDTYVIAAIFLSLVFLNFLYDFFRREKILHDESLDHLDEKTKDDIKQMIQRNPRKFNSLEEEIIDCYQVFHNAVNKIFYQNELASFSPPPRALGLEESKLTSEFKIVAEQLSRAFVPIYYGKQQHRDSTISIKSFRKAYQKFVKITQRLTSH